MERTRFLSLDVFRGMALCVMVIVNTPGAGAEPYPILDHAPWFGFTLADVVFPSFLFAVGNAMAFGNGKHDQRGGVLAQDAAAHARSSSRSAC